MIYLYQNVTPNRGQNTHYVFTSEANYISEIETLCGVSNIVSFAEKNYRINSGVCMIYLTNAQNPQIKLHAITYLRHEYIVDSTTTPQKLVNIYYHVTRAEMEAGYIRLYLAPDLWATNFSHAKFSNFFVERCSQKIHTSYFYPEIERVHGTPSVSNPTVLSGNINSSSLSIVYVVSYAANPNVSPFDSAGARFSVFANQLNRVTTSGSITEDITLDKVIERIGGIRGVVGTFIGIPTERDAQVVKAFIVPTSALSNYAKVNPANPSDPFDPSQDWITDVTFTSRISSGDFHFSPVFMCAPSLYTRTANISPSIGYDEFFGTRFTQLKIPKYSTAVKPYCAVHFITKSDGMQVVLQVNEETRDLTDQFQIAITYGNADANATDAQKRGIQNGLALVGMAAAFADPTKLSLAGVAGLLGSSIASNVVKTPTMNVSGGDGVFSFYNGTGTPQSNTYYKNPFYLVKYASCVDENKNIGMTGAIFNRIYTSVNNPDSPLLDIPDYSDIASSGSASPLGAFVQGRIAVTNIQADAAQFMENELAGGIYVKKV